MPDDTTTPTNGTATTITVIDSIMGSGKTTWMLNHMNEAHAQSLSAALESDGRVREQRFLYVAPTLDEVDRVIKACPELRFKDPQPIHGRKLWGLAQLIEAGEHICTTHALFSMLNRDIYRLLRERNYVLIIDEVVTCVDMLHALKKADQQILFDGQFVSVDDETGRLQWNHDRYPEYAGRFDDIRNLCENGNLVVYRHRRSGEAMKDTDPVILLWEFPSEFLRCFSSVYVMTYLFHGSPMSAYLNAEGLDFDMRAVADGKLINWLAVDEAAIKAKLRSLVTIYSGKMNMIGARGEGRRNPLSSSWFDRADEQTLKVLKSSTTRFFECVAKTPSASNAYTTFKKAKHSLGGKGYARGFIPINAKATNKYIEKESLAYLANVFHQPVIKGFFDERGIPVYEEMFALSEMLQWIWRSQVRRGDRITVYVPSERMRGLLTEWLNASQTSSLLKAA